MVGTWARENGYHVGVRGRLATEVWDVYEGAHADGVTATRVVASV